LNNPDKKNHHFWNRRRFLIASAYAALGILYGPYVWRRLKSKKMRSETFIARVPDYSADISRSIKDGLSALRVTSDEIRGKRILLKPNLVETHPDSDHINTHPMVLHGAVDAFLTLGAREVLIAEGSGHNRDTLLVLEESGLSDVLVKDNIRFVDLNDDDVYVVPNSGGRSRLKNLIFPETLRGVDWIVSMAKMKTHHWAGATLSMKNLFGVMPGCYYGWPKNVLHWAGINETIMDIYATLCPHFAIVDGIVGMDGDGPIMGTPHSAGILVLGKNYPAVDATCARIMKINPYKLAYLSRADGWLGTIRESNISQLGETIESVQTEFRLEENIPAHKNIRLV
jgi:uncharacterized protein (DUF362 family)